MCVDMGLTESRLLSFKSIYGRIVANRKKLPAIKITKKKEKITKNRRLSLEKKCIFYVGKQKVMEV